MPAIIVPFYPSTDIMCEVCAEMGRRWPQAFRWPPRPLAVGLGPVILSALATTPPYWQPPWSTMTYLQLEMATERALDVWTSQPVYLCLTKPGRSRIDLNGLPLGKVIKEEEAWARAKFHKLLFEEFPRGGTPAEIREWIWDGRLPYEPATLN
jgi:sRNA-binding protein